MVKPESINRRADNAMVKRKKEQQMIYKILHYTESELRYSGRVSFSCSTSGTRYSSYIPDDKSRIRKGWGCNYD